MKDPIKITQEELQAALDLKTQFEDSIFQFGNLYIEKLQIESAIKAVSEKESKLQESWKALQIKENDMVQSAFNKYGEGSLDIKQGLFIPSK